jgi:DNA-binding transcriptional regulator LsrR (DeoR family)
MVNVDRSERQRPAELVRAAAVARRFYLDGRSKIQIADEFGLSRFKVARILDEARANGLVHVEITLPAEIDSELSEALRLAYGLRHAIVVSTPDRPETSLRAHLGRVAADLLTELVVEGDVLGVGWGRTVNAVTAALSDLAPCTVVQLSGALIGARVDDSSVESVRRVASVSGGPMYPIYAPLVVPDAATAAGLRHQTQVAEAMGRHDDLTKAIIGVGSWEPPDSKLRDAVSEKERRQLLTLGVRAEVCGTLIDVDGHPVDTDLGRRVISITGHRLRRIPEVIAVTGGSTKAAAARAVVYGRYATSLVTDRTVAEHMLTDPPRPPPA